MLKEKNQKKLKEVRNNKNTNKITKQTIFANQQSLTSTIKKKQKHTQNKTGDSKWIKQNKTK